MPKGAARPHPGRGLRAFCPMRPDLSMRQDPIPMPFMPKIGIKEENWGILTTGRRLFGDLSLGLSASIVVRKIMCYEIGNKHLVGTGIDMRNILLASAMATAGLIGNVQTASAQTFDLTAVQAACATVASGALADPAACNAAIAAFLNGAALLPPTQRLAAIRQLQVYVMTALPPEAQTLPAVLRIAEEEEDAEQDASGI